MALSHSAKTVRSRLINRVVLIPDCDEEGEAGFREFLWSLAERHVAVRLGCSIAMFDGRFAGRQPEDRSPEDWNMIETAL